MNNSKPFSLIVPAAADKAEYADRLPYLFTTDEEGVMLCVKCILGLNLEDFSDIYFTILRKHAEAFDVDKILGLQLRRLGLSKAKIVILDHATDTQAQTIARTIEKGQIAGPLFVKDADSYFQAEIYPENGVAVYPLEELEMVDPRNKSYVAVDDGRHITNIIEKRIVSHLFNAGGYCFEDADEYLSYCRRLQPLGNIYLSHLVYSMLLAGSTFRPIDVSDYRDWGTQRLFHRDCAKS